MAADRAYYRVRYPVLARPTFFVGGRSAEVFDVAEYGISFRIEGLGELRVGTRMIGRLEIGGRHTLELDGDVVWITDGLAAIRLHEPISYRIILEEQLLLRARYPER